MKTLAFINQKGGTGKTTSTLSVAAGIAAEGYKVLLVDLDGSGNLSTAAGCKPKPTDVTIFEVLTGSATASQAIQSAGAYDIIPADARQAGTDLTLVNTTGRDYILKEALAEISRKYDYCVLDCPPSLSITTVMGLTAADGVTVVLKADYLALEGVSQLKDTIDLVKKRTNPKLKIIGVLLTFYGRRALDRQIKQMTADSFPKKLFSVEIPQDVKLGEAPAFGEDIFKYKPTCNGAKAYKTVVAEVIERTQKKKK